MVKHHYKTGINKLSLVGMQLPEKYKENFDVLSEDPSNSRRRPSLGKVEIFLIFFK
jgi:hypothetical protein